MSSEPTADQRIQTISLFVIATVAVGFVLYWLQAVLVPFVLSLFIALGLSPLIGLLTGPLRMPRWLAVLVTLVIAIAFLGLVGSLITTSANRLAANAVLYQTQVRGLIDGFLQRFPIEQYGINPDDVVREHGADAMRLYEMFIGPLEKAAPWSTEGIQGIYRFLQRAWRLFHEEGEDESSDRFLEPAAGAGTEAQQRLTAETIASVTEDLEAMRFNTAISKLMVFARDIAREAPMPRDSAEAFLLLLAPMAPHLAEEAWERLGHDQTLAYESWPTPDERFLTRDTLTLVVQVNGKKRGEIEVPADVSREDAERAALAVENVQKALAGREPKKVIVVPGRLVNVVG